MYKLQAKVKCCYQRDLPNKWRTVAVIEDKNEAEKMIPQGKEHKFRVVEIPRAKKDLSRIQVKPGFAARLYTIMRERGLNIPEVAEICDIAESSVRKYMHEGRLPFVKTAENMAQNLGVPKGYLTGRFE